MEVPIIKQKTLAEIASQYVGKRETPNNSGFQDKEFEKRMKTVGFSSGQAWCCYFAELCVIEWATAIGRKDIVTLATKLFSGGSTATYKAMDIYAKANPTGIVKVSQKWMPNCVGIYRHGNGWEGHTVIPISENANRSTPTYEGNTNSDGSREGIEVAKKKRNPADPFKPKGLNFVGYFSFQ